jgi:hypothetical protein
MVVRIPVRHILSGDTLFGIHESGMSLLTCEFSYGLCGRYYHQEQRRHTDPKVTRDESKLIILIKQIHRYCLQQQQELVC